MGVAGVVVASLLPALGDAPASAAPARKLAEKRVTLTKSIAGMPESAEPGRQIERAVVRVIYDTASGEPSLNAEVRLKGQPQRNPDSEILVGIGTFAGNDCQIEATDVLGVWAADGRDHSLWEGVPRTTTYDCAVVGVKAHDDPGTYYDVMIGKLVDRYVSPNLVVGKVEVLGRNQKQLRLVRGATQVHHVTVRNRGGLDARGVTISGSGKGVRVKRTKVGRVRVGEAVTVRVPIRLTGGRTTKARLRVAGSGATGARVLKVRPVAAPARPTAGSWRGGETFRFRVQNGRITGFRGINMRMTCQPPGQFATYKNVSLGFPKVKVPRHGVVDAVKKYRKGDVWYTAHLRARIAGGKLVAGRYRYVTAGSCSVSEGFTARRVGR